MRGRVAKALLLVAAAPVIAAAANKNSLDLTLGQADVFGSSASKLSLGSVGLDIGAGKDTVLPQRVDGPQYFMIPSERPPGKVPGFVFSIPFETGPSQ